MDRRTFLGGMVASSALTLDARPSPSDIDVLQERERATTPLRTFRAAANRPRFGAQGRFVGFDAEEVREDNR